MKDKIFKERVENLLELEEVKEMILDIFMDEYENGDDETRRELFSAVNIKGL